MENMKEKLKDTAHDQKVFETEMAGTIQKEENKERKGRRKLLWARDEKWSSNMPSGRGKGLQAINLDTYSKIIN